MNTVPARLGFFLFMAFVSTGGVRADESGRSIEDRLSDVQRFEFTDPRIDQLGSADQKVLANLIAAGQVIDSIYLDQIDPRNNAVWFPAVRKEARQNPEWKKILEYFWISFGPWDVIDEKWILPKDDRFPSTPILPGKGFFPADIYGPASADADARAESGKATIGQWLSSHPQDKPTFTSPYTVIRRQNAAFTAVPYSSAYREKLGAAAGYLAAAGRYTTDPKLKQLLVTRAQAFRDNTYDETERFWIDAHDSDIQFTLGPYEQYEDEVLGVKGSFEVRVGLKDLSMTKQLDQLLAARNDLQKNVGDLNVPNMYLGDVRGQAHMTVMNEVFYGGNARYRIPAMAHKLPNNESVIAKYGLRQVFFKNVFDGKCDVVLKPLSRVVMAPKYSGQVSCDSFVKFTLHHENAHALGPAFYYPEAGGRGKKQDFDQVLGPDASPLEEAKADVMGVYDRDYLLASGTETMEGKTEEDLRSEMYSTFVAGIFRSIRFGPRQAHARGNLLQFNRLREFGALSFDSNGQVIVNHLKMPAGVKDLLTFILTLQTNGDSKALAAALEKYGVVPPEMDALFSKLKTAGIPRDLYPVFPVLKKPWIRNLG